MEKAKYLPYWVLNPMDNKVTTKSIKNWSFFTTTELKNGESPLKDQGTRVYQSAHYKASIYDHCIWIFYNKKIDNSDEYSRLTRVLKAVSETFCNSFLSGPGVILNFEDIPSEIQPPSPVVWVSSKEENLTNDKLNSIINVTENIYHEKLDEYLQIFEYLTQINQSSSYVRELALWSFIEQHWNDKNGNSNLRHSLTNLMNEVYSESDPKRIDFENKLIELGKYITGKESDSLTHIRNSLAHGWFFKKKDTWDQDAYKLFYFIHQFLHRMMLQSIKEQIVNDITTKPKLH